MEVGSFQGVTCKRLRNIADTVEEIGHTDTDRLWL